MPLTNVKLGKGITFFGFSQNVKIQAWNVVRGINYVESILETDHVD
jgi:hypothetical protein